MILARLISVNMLHITNTLYIFIICKIFNCDLYFKICHLDRLKNLLFPIPYAWVGLPAQSKKKWHQIEVPKSSIFIAIY